MPHLHLIGAGGIGVSALGRFYKKNGWTVSASDSAPSDITNDLEKEGIHVNIGHREENLPKNTDLVIYSEAIITKPDLSKEAQLDANPELKTARFLGIRSEAYPEALGTISNERFQIAVAGSHGKSTTTSLVGTMLKRSQQGGSTVVGTKLSEFSGTNLHTDLQSPFFAIEACEYRRSFLHYTPTVSIITNIDIDHLDYYKDADDYLSAFIEFVRHTKKAVILPKNDPECLRLYEKVDPIKRDTLDWYFVDQTGFIKNQGELQKFPPLSLKVPGEHLLLDAKLAYVAGIIAGISESEIINGLEAYAGAWRRSEIVGTTQNNNILLSDYGHHPSEIRPTLLALKQAHPDRKMVVVFQPHQYSRTRELLSEFATCFESADHLIIPNIYFSRDKKEDVEWMTVDRLVETIRPNHPMIENGQWLDHTLNRIQELDALHPWKLAFVLLGAGNVDELRHQFGF